MRKCKDTLTIYFCLMTTIFFFRYKEFFFLAFLYAFALKHKRDQQHIYMKMGEMDFVTFNVTTLFLRQIESWIQPATARLQGYQRPLFSRSSMQQHSLAANASTPRFDLMHSSHRAVRLCHCIAASTPVLELTWGCKNLYPKRDRFILQFEL